MPATVRSVWQFTKVFIASKAVLLAILYLQPAEYDTSSLLLFPGTSPSGLLGSVWARLARRLVIWDTVFHVSAAQTAGPPLYEHEWAFGVVWSRVVRASAHALMALAGPPIGKDQEIYLYVAASTLVSTLSHYLATIALYFLTIRVLSRPTSPYLTSLRERATTASQQVQILTKEEQAEQAEKTKKLQTTLLRDAERTAVKTASLYALTPGGVFMLAGYSEPLFALISFLGMLLREHQLYIPAGLLFAAASGLRSNGLLWGLFFLTDLANTLAAWYHTRDGRLRRHLAWLAVQIITAGSLIALAFFGLQYYAYTVYCTSSTTSAPWCTNTPPLIYSYIQARYWNNGFLRYWTPNNIPNFLFAAPTLAIMFASGRYYASTLPARAAAVPSPAIGDRERSWLRRSEYLGPYLVIQAIMFVACLLFWHVQIITRVGTCLPAVYWYTAEMLMSTRADEVKRGKLVARYFMVWIVVQGVFFSAFMPPA